MGEPAPPSTCLLRPASRDGTTAVLHVLTCKRIKSENSRMATSISPWINGTAADSRTGTDTDSSLDPPSRSEREGIDTLAAAARAAGWVKPAHEFARTLRKDRLPSDLLAVDMLLEGGLARGRISEIIGRHGAGKTSLAARFTAAATQRGETAAWIDSSGAFDPASLQQADVILSRVLWVNPSGTGFALGRRLGPARQWCGDEAAPLAGHFVRSCAERPGDGARRSALAGQQWRAAELALKAGGFGLLVLDLGSYQGVVSRIAALRLARAAEQSATAVLILTRQRMCGSFAALTLALKSAPRFSRLDAGAPVLFDGLKIEARLARNKLGAPGRAAAWSALTAPPPARSALSVLLSRPVALVRAVSG